MQRTLFSDLNGVESLQYIKDYIPWKQLDFYAGIIANEPKSVDQVLRKLKVLWPAPYQSRSYLCLFLPAILALAAPRLSLEARREAVAVLLQGLENAHDHEDEFMAEVITVVCGRMGAEVVLPAAMKAMPNDFQPDNYCIDLWSLLILAIPAEDDRLRQVVITFSQNTLRAAARNQVPPSSTDCAAALLARLNHQESLPLLNALTKIPGLRRDAKYWRDVLEGKTKPHAFSPIWSLNLKNWIRKKWQALHDHYRRDEEPLPELLRQKFQDMIQDEYSMEPDLEELIDDFMDSPEAARLNPQVFDAAEYAVTRLLYYALEYEDVWPEDWDRQVLRNVLLEHFPHHLAADQEFFQDVAPITQAFLSWLKSEGLLPNAHHLIPAVQGWSKEIIQRGMDPRHWSPQKARMMAAPFADPYDNFDLDEDTDWECGDYLDDDNLWEQPPVPGRPRLRLLPPAEDEPVAPAPWETTRPIVNAEPKISRNDPCPCGSGKKYKKCCAR